MKERMEELIKIINEADYNYHTLDNPTITDQEYDKYLRELIEIEEKMVYTLKDKEQEWTARKEGDIFIVEGRAVDRLMGRINIEDNESMYYFHKCLKNMGIDDKLKELGICDGDTVLISDWELEWQE